MSTVQPDRGSRPIQAALPDWEVTIILPVYDESASLEGVLDRCILAAEELPLRAGVLVLNDGSTDWSDKLEQRLAARPRVQLRNFYPNAGKGAVLNRAFPDLSGRYAVVIDSDGEYAPEEIERLLLPLHNESADWVMGSRYGLGRSRPRQYLATWLVNRIVNLWFRLLSGRRFHDLLTGLYAFRTALVRDVELQERRFSYSAELIWRVLNHGDVRWCEVPISYRFRGYSEGKKIRWWETATILSALWRYRGAGRKSD